MLRRKNLVQNVMATEDLFLPVKRAKVIENVLLTDEGYLLLDDDESETEITE